MKKILSLFLIICLLFTISACGVENQASETTNINDKTDDPTSSSSNFDEKDITSTFIATVIEQSSPLLVQTDDPDMLRCADRFHVSLPDDAKAEDFKVGDVIEITFRGSISEIYPARISDVVSICLISRPGYPQPIEFFARILNISGQTLFIHGDIENCCEYLGYAYLQKDISANGYAKGDYVALTFSGMIMESYPPQIHVNAIRALTEKEIAELPELEEQRICLQYIGKDDTKIIGICMDKAYAVSLSDFENIPEMTFGNYFTVIYEEMLPSIEPTQLLFIKDLYRCDENGTPLETSSELPDDDSIESLYRFKATVLGKGEHSILVKTDDEQMLRSSDQYWVSLPEGVLGENFEIGEEVEISFAGLIGESYPAQIDASTVFAIAYEE